MPLFGKDSYPGGVQAFMGKWRGDYVYVQIAFRCVRARFPPKMDPMM